MSSTTVIVAVIAAFQHDQKLFNDAFDQNIVVVTPTTLLATLRTVANLISQTNEFVALGVRVKKEFSRQTLDTSDLSQLPENKTQ